VTNPDGSWILYDYFDDFWHWGELAAVYSPWQDSPTAYSSAASTNCKFTSYQYAPQVYTNWGSGGASLQSAFETVSAGDYTLINGVETNESSISSSFSNNAAYGNVPLRADTIQNYASSSVAQTTIKTVFDNLGNQNYNGKLYSKVNPDGTKTSASYVTGVFTSYLGIPSAFNGTNFAPGGGETTWCETYLSGTSTQQDPTAVQYSSDGMTGGKAIDPVWMTPFKSFRRQLIRDAYGNIQYSIDSVYTGTAFQIISWTVTNYNADGTLGSKTTGTGSVTSYTYTNGQVTGQGNPDGTDLNNSFDGLNRMTRSIKSAVNPIGSYAAQTAIETSYAYDPAGHLLSTTTEPLGGGVTLETSSTYYLSGLLESQTDEKSLTTNYSYTNGGRTVTAELPNGSTKVTDKHLDGAPKSITGNAQVNQFSSSVVSADGTITTTTYLGTSGSPRWSSTQTDWLGRTIAQTTPAFGGGTIVKASIYNNMGQLTQTVQSYYNSSGQFVENTQSATLYQYDGLGKLLYTALDVNNNGLNTAS
jgi:hypothetical protein